MSAYERAILYYRKAWIYSLLRHDAKKVYKWKLKARVRIREWKSSWKAAILGEHTKAKDFDAMAELLLKDPRLDLTQLMRGMNEKRGWHGRLTTWWLLSVEELQVWGHFPDAICVKGHRYTLDYLTEILSQGNDCQVRKHLINFHDYWNDPDHTGSIDELNDLVADEIEYWNPSTGNMLTTLEQPDGCATMHPRQLLDAVREQVRKLTLEEDVTYDWLDDLNGDPKNGFKVLRSKYEINNAAERMHNCALSYARSVEHKEIVLVLLEDEDGKALAMGEYAIDSQRWSQISGVCNKQPSDKIIDKFHRYSLQTIHPWFVKRSDWSKMTVSQLKKEEE